MVTVEGTRTVMIKRQLVQRGFITSGDNVKHENVSWIEYGRGNL